MGKLGLDEVFFEDLEIGMSAESPSRTMTEGDIVTFAGLSGDYNVIHTDAELSKDTPFGGRIAHGLLGLSIASGLVTRNPSGNQHKIVAFLGLSWDFKRPVMIGDTIRVIQTVKDKRTTRKPGMGIIIYDLQVKNQRDKICQEGEWKVMYAMRETE